MIFSTLCGFRTAITSLIQSTRPGKSQKSLTKKGKRLHRWRKSPSMTSWPDLKQNLPKTSPQPRACLRFSNPSFWMFPSTRGLSTWITWLFPVTERLSIPVPGSVRPAPAAVWKRASGTVSATVSTTSLTATPAGIPTGNGITLVTAFTRSLPLTPKMTCRYSPCSALPPDMIPMAFGITSSP